MPAAAATVATVLLPEERSRVEAAGQDCYVAVHGDSLDDAIRQVRRRRVDAVFLSVHRCDDAAFPRVARFVREFPHVPAVALISRPDLEAPHRVLGLGASGVRDVVDVSVPAGWGRLRELLREPSSPVAARVMGAIDRDLQDVPPDCRLFFEVVVRRAPELRHMRRWLAPIVQELDGPRRLIAGWFAASSGGALFIGDEAGETTHRYIEVGIDS